jgi:hypothetical protein
MADRKGERKFKVKDSSVLYMLLMKGIFQLFFLQIFSIFGVVLEILESLKEMQYQNQIQ